MVSVWIPVEINRSGSLFAYNSGECRCVEAFVYTGVPAKSSLGITSKLIKIGIDLKGNGS